MKRSDDHRRLRCGLSERFVASAVGEEAPFLRSSVAAAAVPSARAVPVGALTRTQQAVGNAAMQRLLTVQRWDMKVAPTAGCNDVLDHIARASPYKPEAAYTDAHFKVTPSIDVAKEGRTYKATVSSAGLESDITVDMPMWKPEGPMAGPWTKAWRALREHEAVHEQVAEDEKRPIRNALEEVTATGASEKAARDAAFAAAMAKWRKLHAAYLQKQRNLDPYDVDLTCP